MKHLIYWGIILPIGEGMSNKLTIVVCLILVLIGDSFAYRPPKPTRLTQLDVETQVVQLNESLESLWNVVDGRYNLDIVTTNPDGNTKGDVGDMLLFNNSGTYYFAINTTGAKIWRSVVLTDTP